MEEKAELVKIIKQKKGLLRKAEEAASVLDGFVFFLAASAILQNCTNTEKNVYYGKGEEYNRFISLLTSFFNNGIKKEAMYNLKVLDSRCCTEIVIMII